MTETAKIIRPIANPDGAGPPSHGLSKRYAFLVWLPVFLVILGAAAAWHFVHFAFVSAPELNGMILVVMVWGGITMVGHSRRVYLEDRVFRAGMAWIRMGVWSDEPDPKLGPQAAVLGMLDRLQKLGLGHQVYVQSAAMEPELDALDHYFEKRQELSQFIVGLMVGLGLLGTFIGLLETLIATSTLIGTIANSVGGTGSSAGGGMEAQFANIVGGLQKPLAAMGTAFSASMFGLIGSIMLGFQMVIVRSTVAKFIDEVREEVLSTAEKSKVNTNVEITERFLATLLADILQQHKETLGRLDTVSSQLSTLVPGVQDAALASKQLHERIGTQEHTLARAVDAIGHVSDLVPVMDTLATTSTAVLRESQSSNTRVGDMLAFMPDQVQMLAQVKQALDHVATLTAEVAAVKRSTDGVLAEVREHTAVVKRLDGLLLSADKLAMRKLLESDK